MPWVRDGLGPATAPGRDRDDSGRAAGIPARSGLTTEEFRGHPPSLAGSWVWDAGLGVEIRLPGQAGSRKIAPPEAGDRPPRPPGTPPRSAPVTPRRLPANGVPWPFWIDPDRWACEACGRSGRQAPFTSVAAFARWAGDLKRRTPPAGPAPGSPWATARSAIP